MLQQGSWWKGLPSLTVLLTPGLFLAELQSPFRAVSRAQVGLFRKPDGRSKGLTHLQSFCKNVQVLAGGEMEAEVLLESFLCLLDALSFCFLAPGELRVDLLFLLSRSLKLYSQEAKVPPVKQLGSM